MLQSDLSKIGSTVLGLEFRKERIHFCFLFKMCIRDRTYSDNDQKTLEFALAASALKNTIYGDFNQVTVEEVEGLKMCIRDRRMCIRL